MTVPACQSAAQPDLLETVAEQVRHAVRQIDAALVDTRVDEIGLLWLRKVRGTLLATEDVGDLWPEGQWAPGGKPDSPPAEMTSSNVASGRVEP